MSAPQTSQNMNNILRLRGLSSSRRKVAPGSEELNQLDAMEPDLSGTAEPTPQQNLPELEMGSELTPQSYDVRANKVIPPVQPPLLQKDQNGEIPFGRLGNGLASQAREMNAQPLPNPQTPPIETQETDIQEGLPPVSASQQEVAQAQPSALQRLGSYLKNQFTPRPAEEIKETWGGYKDIGGPDFKPSYTSPEEMAQRAPQQQQLDQAAIDRAVESGGEVSVYGATDSFAKQPELIKEFNQYTGLNFDDQMKEATQKYEKVLSDIDEGLLDQDTGYDDQAKRIKERILSNQATDADKFYIGLALVMPLIIGGVFGKEAGIAALGGTAEGFSNVLQGRQKRLGEDEALLADVNKNKGALAMKRGELEIEKLKIPGEIKKSLGENEFADLKGMDIVKMTDPETGEVVGEGPEVLPDLVANLKYYNTSKKREKMTEEAHKLNTDKKFLKQANIATKKIIDAAKQLEDPGVLAKILSIGMSEGVDAGGISLAANSVKKLFKQNAPMIKDENGKSVNAAVYLDSLIEQVKDAYRRNEQMRAFTQTVSSHIGSMAENPLYSGLKPEDLINQMLILRDRSQQIFVDSLEGNGFYPQPMTQEFGKQNRDIYKGLNQREGLSQVEADKQKLLQGE